MQFLTYRGVNEAGRDRARPITGDDILAAQERLILRRDTHIDQLAHKLREERVRRVIEPILAGADEQAWSEEDLLYLRDLGLIAQDAEGAPRIANPIYAEVVPRHLNAAVQAGLPHERAWYVGADGALDVEGRSPTARHSSAKHSEHWVQDRFEQYREAGPAAPAPGAPAAGGERGRGHRASTRWAGAARTC